MSLFTHVTNRFSAIINGFAPDWAIQFHSTKIWTYTHTLSSAHQHGVAVAHWNWLHLGAASIWQKHASGPRPKPGFQTGAPTHKTNPKKHLTIIFRFIVHRIICMFCNCQLNVSQAKRNKSCPFFPPSILFMCPVHVMQECWNMC